MSTLVFTYGSMMNEAEFQRRCPGGQFAFIGVLPDRELCFPRNSVTRGGGVAGVRNRIGASTWGVVWSVSYREILTLDAAEGYDPLRAPERNSYNRRSATAWRDGDALQPVLVDFYDAVPVPNPPAPSIGYLRLINEGARKHKLPSAYITFLENILGSRCFVKPAADGGGFTPSQANSGRSMGPT